MGIAKEKMIKTIHYSNLIAIAACLTACSGSDPKAANEANFEASLEAYYTDLRECTSIGKKPDEDGVIALEKRSLRKQSRNLAALEALTEAGLLEAIEISVDTRNFSGRRTGKQPATQYRLTDAALPFLRPEEFQRGFAANTVEFCYGRRDVTSIDNFTTPATARGAMITRVTYSYEIVDIPEWAQTDSTRAAIPEIDKALSAQSLDDKDDLVLTNTGWKHHRLIR